MTDIYRLVNAWLDQKQMSFDSRTVRALCNELGRAYDGNIGLRDTLHVVDRNLQEMTIERDKLITTLNEWSEQYMHIIGEKCPPDEQHCTCVPALRSEIAKLREELIRMIDTFSGMGSALPGPAFGSGAIAKARAVLFRETGHE